MPHGKQNVLLRALPLGSIECVIYRCAIVDGDNKTCSATVLYYGYCCCCLSQRPKLINFLLVVIYDYSLGAHNFSDLKTLPGGVMVHTYQEVGFRLGLLQDDGEWRKAMQDAVFTQTPETIRELSVSSWNGVIHQILSCFSKLVKMLLYERRL